MEEYKKSIIDRGYKIVSETEDGVSFVNEDIQTCAMLLFKYNDLSQFDKDHGHDLHKTLTNKYNYANKSTICVIVEYEGDPETIQRNEYYFSKVFTDRINILPTKSDKSITVTFDPMLNESDSGDYKINPYDFFDGLACSNFYEFLSSITKDCVVKYPKCLDISYFRYITNKLYTIKTIR